MGVNCSVIWNVSLLFVVVEWLRRERAHGPAEAEAAPEGPDAALLAGEQVRGVLLARGEREPARRVAVVILHRGVERGIYLRLAVVD